MEEENGRKQRLLDETVEFPGVKEIILVHTAELPTDLFHFSPEGSTKSFWVWFPLSTDVENSSAEVANNTAALPQRRPKVKTNEAGSNLYSLTQHVKYNANKWSTLG